MLTLTVRATQKETLVRLRNVYSFFTLYANIDGFDPKVPAPEVAKRSELDRWITSALHEMVANVTACLDGYDIHGSTVHIIDFVDGLSNWYVRRSRDRFWKAGWDDDKRAAYATLYEVLVVLSKTLAPFVPFMAEAMHQNLSRRPFASAAAESVHLADWPAADANVVDPKLAQKMASVRELVSLGLQVRTQAKAKVRQPLRTAHVVLADPKLREGLEAAEAMIREELNVLGVSFVEAADEGTFVTYKLKPNFRTLGQRGLGKEAQRLKKTMGDLTSAAASALLVELRARAPEPVTHDGVALLLEDVEVTFDTKEGFAAAGGRLGVVALDTRLDDELRELGLVREITNRVQNARKEAKLELQDRIDLRMFAPDAVRAAIEKHAARLAEDVLAVSVEYASTSALELSPGVGTAFARVETTDVEGMAVELAIRKHV